MKKNKTIEVNSTCPLSKLPVCLEIDYVERADNGFDKQRFSCSLKNQGLLCQNPNKCPIYDKERIRIS